MHTPSRTRPPVAGNPDALVGSVPCPPVAGIPDALVGSVPCPPVAGISHAIADSTLRPPRGWKRLGAAALALGLALSALPACSSPPTDDDDDATQASPTPTPTPTPTPSPTPFDWTTHLTGLMDFWTGSNVDETYGGYFTDVDREGDVTSVYKWTRMLSRQVYGYCKAFQLSGDVTYLDLAKNGVDFLLTYALDQTYGGFRQQLDADGDQTTSSGKVLPDERDMFSLVYALTGLAAYVEVTADPEVKAVLKAQQQLYFSRGWDTTYGGYYKALDTEMQVLDNGKDFNALVDQATAYLLTMYAAAGDPSELSALREHLKQIGFNISHLIHPEDPTTPGWIGENFTQSWEYDWQDGDFGGDITICGHNLKVVWLLARLHLITGEAKFISQAADQLDFVLPTCRDRDNGGIYDQVDRQTSEIINGYKAWWQQEQGMLAPQLMAQLTGTSYYRTVALETRDFYLTYFPDPVYGEVYESVLWDGTTGGTTKGNKWKSAYHSTENAFFSLLYDSFFTDKTPVTLYYHFDAAEADRIVRLAPVEVPYGTYEIDDPVYLDSTALELTTPSTVTIPAGASGTLTVIYRP